MYQINPQMTKLFTVKGSRVNNELRGGGLGEGEGVAKLRST